MTRIITESAFVSKLDWNNQSWIGLASVELSLVFCSTGQPSDWPFFFRGWRQKNDALLPRLLQPLGRSLPACSTRAYFALSRRPRTRSSSGRRWWWPAQPPPTSPDLSFPFGAQLPSLLRSPGGVSMCGGPRNLLQRLQLPDPSHPPTKQDRSPLVLLSLGQSRSTAGRCSWPWRCTHIRGVQSDKPNKPFSMREVFLHNFSETKLVLWTKKITNCRGRFNFCSKDPSLNSSFIHSKFHIDNIIITKVLLR